MKTGGKQGELAPFADHFFGLVAGWHSCRYAHRMQAPFHFISTRAGDHQKSRDEAIEVFFCVWEPLFLFHDER
jgi:hypothetical protein